MEDTDNYNPVNRYYNVKSPFHIDALYTEPPGLITPISTPQLNIPEPQFAEVKGDYYHTTYC